MMNGGHHMQALGLTCPRFGPTYDQELRTYGSKHNTNSEKRLGVNKVIRKHHALQTNRRGKPILPNGHKG